MPKAERKHPFRAPAEAARKSSCNRKWPKPVAFVRALARFERPLPRAGSLRRRDIGRVPGGKFPQRTPPALGRLQASSGIRQIRHRLPDFERDQKLRLLPADLVLLFVLPCRLHSGTSYSGIPDGHRKVELRKS